MLTTRRVFNNKLRPLGLDINIVLVEPSIPQNTGNIGRMCLGYNATLHIVGPLGFSLDGKYTKRAGLDYWSRVQKKVWQNWDEFKAQQQKEFTYRYYFSTKASESLLTHSWANEIPPPEENKNHSVALFFGCESKGLFEIIGKEEMEDGKILVIPMNPEPEAGFRSYNLANSVAVAVWDLYKGYYKANKQFLPKQ